MLSLSSTYGEYLFFLLPWPRNQGEAEQHLVKQDPRGSEELVPVRDDSAQASEPQGASPSLDSV